MAQTLARDDAAATARLVQANHVQGE